ncbi:hypothetical protein [Lactobacillus crispatus]|uniref:hypothetical protein n=1 Tax=Lactobacillus crispatus TaxID=47770 RepID=UPI0021C82029|nr:hypothetical protein [Lactobacillus crispatus]
MQCLKQFEKLADNRCSGCDKELGQGFMCSDCRNWQAIYGENILHNHALYRYLICPLKCNSLVMKRYIA